MFSYTFNERELSFYYRRERDRERERENYRLNSINTRQNHHYPRKTHTIIHDNQHFNSNQKHHHRFILFV